MRLPDIPCPLLVTDGQGRISFANPELVASLGGTQQVWLAQPLENVMTRASAILCQTHVWPMLLREGKVREIYLELKSASGEKVPVMTNAHRTVSNGLEQVIWIFFVARERSQYETSLLASKKQAELLAVELAQAKAMLAVLNAQLEARVEQTEQDNRTLTNLSSTDALTGLGNRRALDQFAHTLVAQRKPHESMPLSVLLIDVDHFKRVNDTRGHDVGDQVLAGLARCLRDCARQSDAVVRYGGEEFALLLPGTDVLQAELLAQRVHERVQALRPAGIDITLSIGIATAPLRVADDVALLITRADAAVYQAKHDGRSCTRIDKRL